MPLLRHEKIPLRGKDRGLEPQQQHSVTQGSGPRHYTHRAIEFRDEVRRWRRTGVTASFAAADEPHTDERSEGRGHAEAERRAD